MKIEKLKEMIDVIDAVQKELTKDLSRFIPSTSLEIDINADNALVKARHMRPEVVSALASLGFSVRIEECGASIGFKSED